MLQQCGLYCHETSYFLPCLDCSVIIPLKNAMEVRDFGAETLLIKDGKKKKKRKKGLVNPA